MVSRKQCWQDVTEKVLESQLSPDPDPIEDNILHLAEQKVYNVKWRLVEDVRQEPLLGSREGLCVA